jgi:membrane protein
MEEMFFEAVSFNQSLNRWNVSNVKDMARMFCDAKKFDQDLSMWKVQGATNTVNMFLGSPLEYRKPKWEGQ